MCGGECWNDVEARQRASSGNGGAIESGEGVAIGMRDFFNQTQQAQPFELTRHCRWRELQVLAQVCAAPAVDVELAVLQSSQQRVVDGVEEVQTLDAGFGAHARLAQPLQVALTGAGGVQTGEERQVALVAAQQDLAQIDDAIGKLLCSPMGYDISRSEERRVGAASRDR